MLGTIANKSVLCACVLVEEFAIKTCLFPGSSRNNSLPRLFRQVATKPRCFVSRAAEASHGAWLRYCSVGSRDKKYSNCDMAIIVLERAKAHSMADPTEIGRVIWPDVPRSY
jgi:hypothetical protein